MKFNVNKPTKAVRRARKKEDEQKALEEWHSKFAWLPTVVDEATDSHSRVWLERYMRQQRIGPTNRPFDDGKYFVRYSTKEYFKKKLNGDFDVEKNLWGEDIKVEGASSASQIMSFSTDADTGIGK